MALWVPKRKAILIVFLFAWKLFLARGQSEIQVFDPTNVKQGGVCTFKCTRWQKKTGGCIGREGKCKGVCYCFGSGFEFRCVVCDIDKDDIQRYWEQGRLY